MCDCCDKRLERNRGSANPHARYESQPTPTQPDAGKWCPFRQYCAIGTIVAIDTSYGPTSGRRVRRTIGRGDAATRCLRRSPSSPLTRPDVSRTRPNDRCLAKRSRDGWQHASRVTGHEEHMGAPPISGLSLPRARRRTHALLNAASAKRRRWRLPPR
jgi:hypothetical protein